jgi:predicted HNH restriction endonuclease
MTGACFQKKNIMEKREFNANKKAAEQPEGGEKEFQVQPGQSGGEQTDDKVDTGLDSKNQETTVGRKGNGTGDQTVNGNRELDDETEAAYQEAKEVIGKMVDNAIGESGILDEPQETTGKRNRIAKDVFEKNAQCKVLYFTADLIPFFVKSDAFRHGAGTLKNNTVVTINRK